MFYADIHLKKLKEKFVIFMKNSSNTIALFKGKLSSESNLIFIYFLSKSSTFLFIDLIKSQILLHSSSYMLIFSLLSLVGTSVR